MEGIIQCVGLGGFNFSGQIYLTTTIFVIDNCTNLTCLKHKPQMGMKKNVNVIILFLKKIEFALGMCNYLRASPTGFAIPSYFTILKSYFINYTVPFYNIPNIPKLYYFTILLKYYFFNLSLLFLSNICQSESPKTTSCKSNHQQKRKEKKNHIQWVATNPSNLQPTQATCNQTRQRRVSATNPSNLQLATTNHHHRWQKNP